jgi:hypothetical protein
MKGKVRRRSENMRMSHPIAPKGQQKQADKENAPKGYRIVLVCRNSKERSFGSSAAYTRRET